MTRYIVKDVKGKLISYVGFNYNRAWTTVLTYKQFGLELYVDEEEIDRDYNKNCYMENQDGTINVDFYDDDQLTSVYGDNEAIRNIIVNRIETDYKAKIVNAKSLIISYTDPGTTGSRASFHVDHVKLGH